MEKVTTNVIGQKGVEQSVLRFLQSWWLVLYSLYWRLKQIIQEHTIELLVADLLVSSEVLLYMPLTLLDPGRVKLTRDNSK